MNDSVAELEELLRALPFRAVVALLARNARRLQPLFLSGSAWDRDARNLQAIEDAIRSAEAFAAGAAQADDDGTAAFGVAMRCVLDLSPAAFAAALAACVADHAADLDSAPEAAGEALAAALQALYYFAAALPDETGLVVVHADLAVLLARGSVDAPQRGAPIDPSEAGPLGPLWLAGVAPPWDPPPDSREAG
jgi:hypothetical protein